ncbi:unnamed protein product [Adineta steineri]|uniref:Tectonic-1-3 domain-containing protein n=2 Tax=Adineta steineri TaxID=433720 RepID=A0A818XQ77_9BILA|nr:unnamed protein product [Adineta steineri]CAF3740059.1 unnamed protein product [Adineta steineri]
MVDEALSNFGLFIDDENKIRLINPERVTDSAELRDECKDFIDNVLEFKKIVDTLIEKTEDYSKQVEAARLRSIGAKNMLKSAAKYREFEKQQLQSLIKEKMVELERLRAEHESLQKTEREQNEKMEQLSLKSLKSTGHSTCFKDVPIYKSNSPYAIQKKDNLICIDHEQDIDYSNYEQLINENVNLVRHSRSINIDNSVSSSIGTPFTLDNYELGTSVFRFIPGSSTTSYYSLPIKIFNSQMCSGFQPITYLNNFVSACTQPITQQTCLNGLDATKYSNFCLIKNPSTLINTPPTYICCSANASVTTTYASPACNNALATLDIKIYYSNPAGIMNCTIGLTTIASASTPVSQTISVTFIEIGPSNSSTTRSGNPGYFQGAPVIARTSNGTSYTTSALSIPQASSTDGTCSSVSRTTIHFGQNIQSTCLFGLNSTLSCPNVADPTTALWAFSSFNISIAARGNSDPSNLSDDWLPIIFCTSQIGSSSGAVCQNGSMPSISSSSCYTRLDIQIAYANIGAVTNPQPILGAVIFHYQSVNLNTTTTLPAPLLFTHTITFQDISNAPATEGDQIPRPNTRLVGDFFYPFSLSHGNNSISFSLFVYLLITFLIFLM